MKISSNPISYITKIRKDQALRIPDDIFELGYIAGKTVQVTIRILETIESTKSKKGIKLDESI